MVTISVSAQTFNKGAIIVEGNNYGASGNLVKMAKYEPNTKNYVYFDSILGDFTNDVLIFLNALEACVHKGFRQFDTIGFTHLK